jgi:hypothetical protein
MGYAIPHTINFLAVRTIPRALFRGSFIAFFLGEQAGDARTQYPRSFNRQSANGETTNGAFRAIAAVRDSGHNNLFLSAPR